MTTVTDINDYIALKAALNTQILADDTVANIQTTLTNLASLKAGIVSGLAASTVLDSLSLATTEDKMNFITQTHLCRVSEQELNILLISWYTRLCGLIDSEATPSNVPALYTKRNQIIAILQAAMVPQVNFIAFATDNR